MLEVCMTLLNTFANWAVKEWSPSSDFILPVVSQLGLHVHITVCKSYLKGTNLKKRTDSVSRKVHESLSFVWPHKPKQTSIFPVLAQPYKKHFHVISLCWHRIITSFKLVFSCVEDLFSLFLGTFMQQWSTVHCLLKSQLKLIFVSILTVCGRRRKN